MQLLKRESPLLKYPVYLRSDTSDQALFDTLLGQDEYGYICFSKRPETILDMGANIGLSTAYFASKYPTAKIIALEPEKENYELLKSNTRPYPNVIPVLGALMSENGVVEVVDTGEGTLAFQTKYVDSSVTSEGVPCWNIEGLCRKYNIPHIDFLKIDIEGAERDIFQGECCWLSEVSALAIELHERYREGTNKVVFTAVGKHFELEWIGSENYYFARYGVAWPQIPPVFKRNDPQPLPVERLWQEQKMLNDIQTAYAASFQAINARLDVLDALFPRVDAVEGIFPRLDEVEKLYPRLDEVEKLYPRMDAVEGLYPRVDKVEGLYPRMDAVEGLYARMDAVEGLYPRVDRLEELLSKLEEVYFRADKAEELCRRLEEMEEANAELSSEKDGLKRELEDIRACSEELRVCTEKLKDDNDLFNSIPSIKLFKIMKGLH